MDPDLSRLDAYLERAAADAYLIEADGEDSDQRYLSGFTAPDPFVTLYTGETHLLVSTLEYGRARRQSRADSVARLSEFDHRANVEEYGQPEGQHRTLAAFLDVHGVDAVAAPSRFPLGTADGLRDLGVSVSVDADGVVEAIRATKTDEEVAHVRDAQRANEAAMARAEELLAAADVGGGGGSDGDDDDGLGAGGDGAGDGSGDTADRTLLLDGEPLTAERVKREIEIELLERDCALDETIVACGTDAADPHDRGSGPLVAGEPIIVDIFPRSKVTGYHADMTRTFCVGEPDDVVAEWYDLTLAAQRAALEAVEAGVSGSAVHGAVCDVYEDAGLPTLRSDESAETGFIHTTGHGVGLDVHERPRLSTQDETLEAGHVVTVEPGLYDPAVGGVRIEDLVVVTEDGHENLTDYEKSLRV